VRHRHAKATHKKRRHIVHHKAKPQPVTFRVAPIADLVAATALPLPPASESRDRYLRFAGFAFAVLAVVALSLHVLSTRIAPLKAR
jgi:hypothetical protein